MYSRVVETTTQVYIVRRGYFWRLMKIPKGRNLVHVLVCYVAIWSVFRIDVNSLNYVESSVDLLFKPNLWDLGMAIKISKLIHYPIHKKLVTLQALLYRVLMQTMLLLLLISSYIPCCYITLSFKSKILNRFAYKLSVLCKLKTYNIVLT